MQFQFDVASTSPKPPANPQQPATSDSVVDALHQMMELQREQFALLLDVQREHLNHVRAAAQDSLARWKNLLSRWQKEHPEFADQCKLAYPVLEKAYVTMLANLVEELSQDGDDALDTDFSVQEFLDRYGMRVSQLSHLLSVVGPLAEAAAQAEAK
jgi:transketolase